jgi:hypothetical protein
MAAFLVSLLSLIVSVFTAYFLLPSDDVRLVVDRMRWYQLRYDESTRAFTLDVNKIVVVNSGNRTITIMGFSVLAGVGKHDDCIGVQSRTRGVGLPIVIEPGKPAILNLETETIQVKAENEIGKQADRFRVCFTMNIITPDAVAFSQKELASFGIPLKMDERNQRTYYDNEKEVTNVSMPVEVYKKKILDLPL